MMGGAACPAHRNGLWLAQNPQWCWGQESAIEVPGLIGTCPQITLKEIGRFASVQLEAKKAVVCVIGENIKNLHGLSADIFMALKKSGIKIHMISYGATGINIAFLVDNRAVRASVQALHRLIFK